MDQQMPIDACIEDIEGENTTESESELDFDESHNKYNIPAMLTNYSWGDAAQQQESHLMHRAEAMMLSQDSAAVSVPDERMSTHESTAGMHHLPNLRQPHH